MCNQPSTRKQEHESKTIVLRIMTPTDSNPMTLREILESVRVGSGVKGRGVYLHTILHSLSGYKADKRQPQENTQFSDFLTAVVSGVIFQVTGVSSWTEVNHIRISSSRMFCSNFVFKPHWNNSWSKLGKRSKLRVFHGWKHFRTNNSV